MTKFARRIVVISVALSAAVMMVMMMSAGGAQAAPRGPVPPRLPTPTEIRQSIEDFLNPQAKNTRTLRKQFRTLERSLRRSGKVGLAITPVGADTPVTFGSVVAGRAWSTLKVPVSLAAERHGGAKVSEWESKAIRASDNDAAGELWGSLGGGRASVDAVTAVLREGHDATTHVSSEVDGPDSYTGYTRWAIADQSRFAANLPCMSGTAHLLSLMSSVESNQDWGIRKISRSGVSTAVKGGWGPVSDDTGNYVVRQLGIITTGRGQLGVSMIAIPRSGGFGDGTRLLTTMGTWLGRNLNRLPMGRCGLL